jgi:hypothetical protein
MDVEYVKAKISVWWNINDCKFPTNPEYVKSIANNIRLALSKANLLGELSISAYGDTNLIASEILNALSSIGISVHHVTSVSDSYFDECYKKIITDMSLWALDNPNANVLLIFANGGNAVPIISRALLKLSMKNYNILLAIPSQVDASLTDKANIVWLWPALFSGEGPMCIEEVNFKIRTLLNSHITTINLF